jgi:6-phosphogluconolactonase
MLEAAGSIPLDVSGSQENPSAAALAISAETGMLYASDRGRDTLEVYAITPASGVLSHRQSIPAGGGKPWSAAISLDGKYLAVTNQASDAVQLFSIDAARGTLSRAGGPIVVPTPTSITFT